MNRIIFAALLLCVAAGGAAAQSTVPGLGGAPNANVSPLPQIAPGPAVPSSPPRIRRHSSTVVQVPGQPLVVMPRGARDRNGFSNRIERCIHYGSAAGVQPNDMGSFSAQCANQ
jgi:hypothetical protein